MLSEPQCHKRRCKHFIGIRGETELDERPVCAAFPLGIPFDIAYGDNPHTTPYPGDGGITYEESKA